MSPPGRSGLDGVVAVEAGPLVLSLGAAGPGLVPYLNMYKQ